MTQPYLAVETPYHRVAPSTQLLYCVWGASDAAVDRLEIVFASADAEHARTEAASRGMLENHITEIPLERLIEGFENGAPTICGNSRGNAARILRAAGYVPAQTTARPHLLP